MSTEKSYSNGNGGLRAPCTRDVFSTKQWHQLLERWRLAQSEAGVMQCMLDGRREKQMPEALKIKAGTVHEYLQRVYDKIGVRGVPDVMRVLIAEAKAIGAMERDEAWSAALAQARAQADALRQEVESMRQKQAILPTAPPLATQPKPNGGPGGVKVPPKRKSVP